MGETGVNGRGDDRAFDETVLASAFTEIAARGWAAFRLADAARAAGLPLARVRERFPTRDTVLLKLGQFADEAALADAEAGELAGGPISTARERLFDMIMRRLDVLQQHRDGVVALLDALPVAPRTVLLLGVATEASIRWLGEAAGLSFDGFRGAFRLPGLVGVWLASVQAWRRDETADLASTMAALDRALDRLARFDPSLRSDRAGGPWAPDNVVPPTEAELADVIVPPDGDLPPDEAPPTGETI